MPLERRDPAYLWDILQAAKNALEFTRGKTYEDYAQDEMLQAAVERKVEIIGEAARRVSRSFQTAHPEIPWRQIAAQRNVIIHEYDRLDSARMWKLVTQHLPRLVEQLAPLIPEPPPDPEPGP